MHKIFPSNNYIEKYIPILSICIPTYNRSTFLERTISSITSQKRFRETNDVEIIVCDNCSTDNTELVSLDFVRKFKNKVKYFKNENNVYDLNFEKALSHGTGKFLKLNNDTLVHKNHSLNFMIDHIQNNINEEKNLFFLNGNLNIKDEFLCNNLNDFIGNISYFTGWIGAFGIWKSDFMNIHNFSRYSELNLAQLDVLLRIINSGKSIVILNKNIFISEVPPKKGGYDLLKVFLENYFYILSEYVQQRRLSPKVFMSEKRKVLLRFIRPFLTEIKSNPEAYNFTHKNIYKSIFMYYKNNLLTFLVFILTYKLSLIRILFKKKLKTYYGSKIK